MSGAMAQDLYSVLGVTRSASSAEIKRAYRKLAKRHHPDVTGNDPRSAEKFKEFNAAFDVLGDAEKRKLYDEFGEDSLKTGFEPGRAREYKKWADQAGSRSHFRGGGPDAGGNPFSGFGFDAEGGAGGFEDFFGNIFGRNSGPVQRSSNLLRELEIDLETAMRGGPMRVTLQRETSCRQCNGTGRTGRSTRTACIACRGSGRVAVEDALTINIPERVPDGSKLTLRGRGESGSRGETGNLVLEIRIRPHPVFVRDGKDLRVELPIAVDEALLGAKVPLVTPDGRRLTVTVPPGSQSGQCLRLKGQGLGTGKNAGNLVATLSIRVPRSGGEDAARELRQAYTDELEVAPRG